GPPARVRSGRAAGGGRLGGRARSAEGADPVPGAPGTCRPRTNRRPAAVRFQQNGARAGQRADKREDRHPRRAGADGAAAEGPAEAGARGATTPVRALAETAGSSLGETFSPHPMSRVLLTSMEG